jgi:hypothetical protein
VTATHEGGFPLTLTWRSEKGGPVKVSMATALGCAAGEAKSILSASAAPLGPKSVGTEDKTPRANARRTTTATPPPTSTCPPPAAAPVAAAPVPPPAPVPAPLDWATLAYTVLSSILGSGVVMGGVLASCMKNERGQTSKARKALLTVMSTVGQLHRDLNVSSLLLFFTQHREILTQSFTYRRVRQRLQR